MVEIQTDRSFMHVLVSCNNGKVLIKNEGPRVVTTFLPLLVNGDFLRHSRAANSAVKGRIWPNFKLIQDFKVVLITSINEENPIKNES